jgi:hypothetical protein
MILLLAGLSLPVNGICSNIGERDIEETRRDRPTRVQECIRYYYGSCILDKRSGIIIEFFYSSLLFPPEYHFLPPSILSLKWSDIE